MTINVLGLPAAAVLLSSVVSLAAAEEGAAVKVTRVGPQASAQGPADKPVAWLEKVSEEQYRKKPGG